MAFEKFVNNYNWSVLKQGSVAINAIKEIEDLDAKFDKVCEDFIENPMGDVFYDGSWHKEVDTGKLYRALYLAGILGESFSETYNGLRRDAGVLFIRREDGKQDEGAEGADAEAMIAYLIGFAGQGEIGFTSSLYLDHKVKIDFILAYGDSYVPIQMKFDNKTELPDWKLPRAKNSLLWRAFKAPGAYSMCMEKMTGEQVLHELLVSSGLVPEQEYQELINAPASRETADLCWKYVSGISLRGRKV